MVLSNNDDIILIDPEREYSALVAALGGESIHISATSPNHINTMNVDNRLIRNNILDLGKQLLPIGMLVVLGSFCMRFGSGSGTMVLFVRESHKMWTICFRVIPIVLYRLPTSFRVIQGYIV